MISQENHPNWQELCFSTTLFTESEVASIVSRLEPFNIIWSMPSGNKIAHTCNADKDKNGYIVLLRGGGIPK